MKFLYLFLFKTFPYYFLLCFPLISLAKSTPALAILSELKGDVITGFSNNFSNGFDGKMLWKKNRIKTGENSSATIFFFDGSQIRLFSKSDLKIGVKKRRSSRWVRYRILLHSGSFWGFFARGKNAVEVGGKGLSLLLSNASIRFTKQKTGNSISVSSGIAKVFNMASSVKLNSGQRLYQVQKKDFLPQKITYIPNQLKLSVEPKNMVFPRKDSLRINLNFQVVRQGTKSKINRSGPIYLMSNYYNIISPDSIRINAEGMGETILEVKPPQLNDRTFEGSVIFHAIMDQNGYDDVQSGSLKVKFKTP